MNVMQMAPLIISVIALVVSMTLLALTVFFEVKRCLRSPSKETLDAWSEQLAELKDGE